MSGPAVAAVPADTNLFAFSRSQLSDIAARYETPCFVYDLGAARSRFRSLRAQLPQRVHLAYAVKSNPGAPLVSAFAAEGAWFDCASAGEVATVLAAGGSGARMVVAGPAKSERDLHAAWYAGARVHVDGIEDVARLAAMNHAEGCDPLDVSVRVNPATGVSESASIIGGGGPSAFGVDEEDLADFLHRAHDYPSVHICGLQVFAASNELDAQRLVANHAAALRIGEYMHAEFGVSLDLIDIGGGLGIPYTEGDPALDIAALGAGLSRLLQEHTWFIGDVLLEPGRWLSGPIGVYLSRVVRVKQSRGTRFAMLEGGINHLLRPLVTGQSFPTMALAEPGPNDNGPRVPFTLAGPLCTSLDRLGEGLLPESLAPGDVVVFGNAGAYAYTQAMTHFLSHPVPEQHWLNADTG